MINIYVGNLPYSTSEGDLEALFAQFGQVIRASIIMDRETGRSRGFGFVEMENPEEGRKAIEVLLSQPYNGRQLTINEAKPREPRRGGAGGAYGYATGGAPRSSGYGRPRPETDETSPSSGYSSGYSNRRYEE